MPARVVTNRAPRKDQNNFMNLRFQFITQYSISIHVLGFRGCPINREMEEFWNLAATKKETRLIVRRKCWKG